MTTINYPELRSIENEQIRVFRLFMEDPQPKYMEKLIELKRRWDKELGILSSPPLPDAVNGFSTSRRLGALRRYKRIA